MKGTASAWVVVFFCLALWGLAPAGESAGQICAVFPADNVWNAPVDTLPLDRNSAAYIITIGPGVGVHPDFGSGDWPPGSGSPIGIPYVTVPGTQPKVQVSFEYSDESDPGPYPIPADAPIEGGPLSKGDRHVLVIDIDDCVLYELYSAYPQTGGSWDAGSGAIFDLKADALRPAGWTSADAAGLPIFPGLVRYDEVASGEISHALRFTAPQTRHAYVWPARHYASSLTGMQYPPMGQRFRLKAGFDISKFSPQNQVILRALKRYGMMLADNGSAWYISGVPDPRWKNDDLHNLDGVQGSDFEAVDMSSLMISPDSAAVKSNINNGLAVNFGTYGLWFYRSGAWSELTPLTPGMMAAYANDMVAVFPGDGLYRYDGAAWTQLTPITGIDRIVGTPERVYVAFTGAGLWQYNGAWTQITPVNPNQMLAFGDNLLANFPGAGLYQYDGSAWTLLTPLGSADSMVAGATTVYVDFPSAGLYAYNGSTWTGLTSLNSTMMTMCENALVANFAGYGIYSWNGSSWTLLTSTVAQGLIGTSTNLYVNFGSYGLFQYNGSWTDITPLSPNLMGSLDASLIANFASYGLYAYDGSAWSLLTTLSSATAMIEVTWP